MPKIYLTLIAFLIIVNNITGQTLKISERKLLKTFQKTILKGKNGAVTTGLSAWYSCNDDSAYFKLDTLSLIHNPDKNNLDNCCNSISWTFSEKDKFLETRYQRCKEPPTGSAAKESDFYQIKFITSTDSTFLKFFNRNGKSYTFKVVELIESSVENSNRPCYELILKRWYQ